MKTILLLLSILILQIQIVQSEQVDLGLSFKLNKSLALMPFENIRTNSDDEDGYKLFDGTFGFAADLLYKSKRRAYFNLSIDYNILSVNDEFNSLNGTELSGSFLKVMFGGIAYMDPPDEFTPYIGYGVGFIFVNSNQNEIEYYDEYGSEVIKGDLISDFTLSLDVKAGLLIPINEKFSLTTDLDFGIYFAQYLGLVPRLQVGGVYWLD